MENPKRLNQLLSGYGMTEEHLNELTNNYFGDKCVRWFYFDLDTEDVPHITSPDKEIDVRVKHIDYPAQVTIELIEVDTPADPSSKIKYGRLTYELIEQIKTLVPENPKGIALTIGKDASGEFLLLELYIKENGEIVIVHPGFNRLFGDNLTPTSIPPGK